MAKNGRKQGTVEFGDIYDRNPSSPDGRGVVLGRLIVDFDTQAFWQRPEGRKAIRLSQEEVASLVSNDLVSFDQPGNRSGLIQYLMKLDQSKRSIRQSEIESVKKNRQVKEMQANERIEKKVRGKARTAKGLWLGGVSAFVALSMIATIPVPKPAEASVSIAGVGQDYGVSSELLENATYVEALGNGSRLYGIVFDNNILEVGQANAGEKTIKENVLSNPTVASTPIHMRPLYYDRSTFYQTEIMANDASTSSTAIYLQNPKGYSLGVAANELVLTGGSGLATLTLSSPDAFSDSNAADAARQIEEKQKERANAGTAVKDGASVMPIGWNGYDSCDIDGNYISASYWYTKSSSLRKEDLKRRVAVYNITDVINKGQQSVKDLMPAQLNYQDLESSFYAPAISSSPSSNGSLRWLGYMKQDVSGNTGFFIRKYELTEDILLESYTNTYSTADITGNSYPISNYTLDGDKLFYEQQGSIWVVDLSKITVTMNGNERTVKRENPVQICKASEIQATVSRDEQFISDTNHTTIVPVAHYETLTLTTANGVEYGITFIEAETGDLVYQPCVSTTVAASQINQGEGAASTADGVTDGNAAAKAAEEAANAARNANSNSSKNSNSASNSANSGNGQNSNQSNGQNSSENGNANGNSTEDSGGSTPSVAGGIIGGIKDSVSTNQTSGTVPYQDIVHQVADSGDLDNGRILIKAADENTKVVCYTVRGEQLIWIEENTANKNRKLMFSPIYYKNDASKVKSEQTETENTSNEATETPVDEGSSNENMEAPIVSKDGQKEPSVPVETPEENKSADTPTPSTFTDVE